MNPPGDPDALAGLLAAAQKDPALVVLEGFHPLKHALRFGAEVMLAGADDLPGAISLTRALAPDLLESMSALLQPLPQGMIGRLAARPIPTGILAVARRPLSDLGATLAGDREVVFLDRPNHLGNIGAVVRVAAAAGAAGVITTGERDPWDPAALRGSAGLHFALTVSRVPSLPESNRPLVAFDPTGEPLTKGSVPRRALLAFGSERRGLDPALLERSQLRLAIPMRPGVSSLNLATAVAVALYSGL